MASSNAIELENAKQGNSPGEWGLTYGAPVGNIEGYAVELSVDVGGTIEFKVNTDATNYRIDIYRLGYYGGDGARLVGTVQHQSANAPIQPTPLRDASTGLVDAGNWAVTDTFTLPPDLISGVYIAKLVRQDGTFGESRIPVIVRDEASTSDIVFQTADATWQAYNPWGGNSLYYGSEFGGFQKAVSYNRPMGLDIPEPVDTTLYGPESYLFGAEYAAIRWLEKNGYDVSYQTTIDTGIDPESLLNHNIFLSVGHDEYWSAEQREAVEAARDAGVNLAFWSGNTMFWKTRIDAGMTGDANKTIVSYKESYPGVIEDPTDTWTGLWRDVNGADQGGGLSESLLTGGEFAVNLGTPLTTIDIPQALCGCFLWANTDVANLAPGETFTLNGNYLGYEWQEVPTDPSLVPANLVAVSNTTVDVPFLLQGTDVTYANGTATHNMTIYRADSGALVFNAGTVFWSWALDDFHVYGPVGPYVETPTDPNAEQAMVNLFAEMGVQPGNTLSYYLQLAAQSTDYDAPVSSVTNLVNGQKLGNGQSVTLIGTTADFGGGEVLAVDISTDGGATWHRASGTTNWSYSWITPEEYGSVSILVKAIDSVLNHEIPTKSLDVSIVDSADVPKFGEQPTIPVSNITNFIDWNLVDAGSNTLITGAAVDPDGGWVGGVELSFDGGQSWTMADGTGNWSIVWSAPTEAGFYDIMYRSGDNDSRLEITNSITLSVIEPGSMLFGGGERPKSSVTNLVDGMAIAAGSDLFLTGTAFDADGFVGGVEVSFDNGYTWQDANGTTNWSVGWTAPTQPGVYKIFYRAGDSDNNLETARSVLINVVDPAELATTLGFPVSAATNYASGDIVKGGETITITGAAIDPDGGYIGGVEFSVDGGKTWTGADGAENWSFDWTAPTTSGIETLLYRAGDNDYKLEIAHPLSLTVEPTLTEGKPSSTVNLTSGSQVDAGSVVTVTGTASDPDGSVDRIEISTDKGYSWQTATGTTNWSYSWNIPSDAGVLGLQYRAVDNAGNAENVHTVLVSSMSRTV